MFPSGMRISLAFQDWPNPVSRERRRIIAVITDRFERTRAGQRLAARLASVVVAPGLVTLLALFPEHPGTTAVALLYVLAVFAAAATAGIAGGVAASLLSFLALNFFFTPPFHTFAVASSTDAVALGVFLLVSVSVGLLLSLSVRERQRAEMRGAELRLLNEVTTSLLSGEEVGAVLTRAADDINAALGSARCQITTSLDDTVELVRRPRVNEGRAYGIALRAKGRNVGRMTIWPEAGQRSRGHSAPQIVDAFAKQLALALEGLRLSREVRNADLEAEANRLKASLFAGVTHDVKTPLAAITASVTSLLDGGHFTTEQSRDHLEMIKQEAERLHRVVNNLLDLARLRAGGLQPITKPGPIDEVVESVVGRLRPLLAGRDVVLRVDDDLDDVPMDVVQIDQVLSNLIENAAKFSPAGSPLYLSARGGAGAIRVTIVDEGPGIPKDDQTRIFEPFEVGSSGGTGTGLGLAISKAIVVGHGGRIWAGRSPGGGASISFELPRGAASRDAST